MKSYRILLFLLFPVFLISCYGQEAPPEKALKYHGVLLKRPQNETLFDRFYSAWIDEQPVEALEKFLMSEAEEKGGQAWSVLARYQLRRGQEDAALVSLGKAMEEVDDPSLPMERAKILMRRLAFDEARKDLGSVAAGDAELALEAGKMIGKSWIREGNSEEAIKAWDALLQENPDDEDLLEDLVESAATEGETEQALKYVEKLIAASGDPYQKTLRALRRGDLLALAGRMDDAVVAYSETLALVGEGSWLEREVLAQIEKLFRSQDRLDDLLAELTKLSEANPRRLLIHRQLAKLEAAQGDTDGAIGRFREVLKRSPGNAELREEFVKLLMESELYDDAVAELEKMIELAKDDAGLQLRMAGLRNQQGKKDEALKALEKAHELAGGDEISGVQVAGLMFQYGLPEQGEALLKSLIELAEATTAPSESLAAQYGKTQRKEEAIVLWKKIAAEGTLDTLLRASAAVSGLGESGVAFELLSTQAEEYPTDTRFLTVLAQISLAADKAADGVPVAMKLVRLSKGTGEIASSVPLAMRVIIAADKSLDLRADLEKQEERSVPEICLLAALAEGQGDFDAVETLFAEISDPILIRFHAAILDRRGEFERAIAALIRLADTDEGRKASFFKELSELQERAGKTDEALATMEKWKQAAPGDKTAWVVASALLRDLGKPDDAARMTRQAVAKFDGDEELSATLASLHEEAGDWADAEGIYWRLYDAAVNPMDQLRWGSQLAQLALKTGRTEELDAKLQERSRGNRKSIGPILARAELARLLKNEDSRRDLLLEAVRLQPKDVDLRLQIANLEEQDGNAERVIAVLQEAVGFDQTGRVRSALAQAYLRQGRTVEGMRELRAIAGARGDDPRSLESSAASLAGAGLYDEAIRFLSESLKDGGDWRSRYLLAVLLEADGRETEAIPIFLTLQQASGELKGTKPKASKNPVNFEGYAEGVRDLIALNHTIRMAYVHEGDSNYSSTSIPMTGVFYLPQTEDEVKELSAIHLAKLSSTRPEVAARAKAVGMDDLDFLAELTKAGDLRRLDWGSMLEKFPKYPGLLETVLLYRGYGQGVEVEIETLSKLVEEREDLSSITRFQATRLLAEGASGEDPIWDELIDLAKKSVEEAKEGEIQALAYSLMRFTQDKNKPVPDAAKEKINAVLLDLSLNHMVKGDGQFDGYFTMFITATAGTTEQWIGALNTLVKDHQDELAKGGIAPPQRRMGYRTQNWNNGQDPFVLAKLGAEILESLPADYIFQISGSSERSYYQDAAVDPKDLVAKLEQFESPLLRAWVAHCAEEEKVLKKALAVEASPLEAADFNVMRAFLSLDKKKYAEAYRLLELNRAAYSAKREKTSWLNFNLVALALEMTKEERAEISDDLRALLIQCRRVMGVSGAPVLAEKAKVLGFEDLAKRFLPPVIVSKSSVSRMGGAGFSAKQKGQSSGGGSLDKLKKFSSEGKTEAAAREALLLLRKALGEKHNSGYELRRLLPEIQKNVRQEVVRMIDPNDSPSLTKRKEYARICALFGKNDLALKTLELLATDRPDDVNVASELAFLLPPEEKERAVGLINRWAKSDDFVTAVIGAADRMSNSTADKESLSYFGLICGWLEKADPADLKGANLSWVAYQAKGFM
ncbi:MAG: tetratricopeptide repeat protein, partial [Luteolibacter sp.]